MTTSNRAGRFSLALLFDVPEPAPEVKPVWRVIQGGRVERQASAATKPVVARVTQAREAA